jgi:maltose O-acetyltransferase
MELGSTQRLTRYSYSWQRKLALLRGRSPREILALARCLLWARWGLRQATTVGKYARLMGRLRVVNQGRLIVGNRVQFHAHVAASELVVLPGAELRIEDGAFINYGAEICAKTQIVLGEECLIGTHCIIMDNDFHHVELDRRDESPPGEPVIIESRVWIGNRVMILKGVHIGYGSVIAAGSVVTKSIPPLSIAAGVPARVLRPLDGAPGTPPAGLAAVLPAPADPDYVNP